MISFKGWPVSCLWCWKPLRDKVFGQSVTSGVIGTSVSAPPVPMGSLPSTEFTGFWVTGTAICNINCMPKGRPISGGF